MGDLVEIHKPRAHQQEMVDDLEDLIRGIKAGSVTGLAYAVMHRSSEVSFNVTGRARLLPIYTLGAVDTLKAYISTSLLR